MKLTYRSLIGSIVLPLLIIFAMPALSWGQTATPLSTFVWTQTGPDLATVSGWQTRQFVDGSATGSVLSPVTTTATATSGSFSLSTPIPAFTPGAHTVQIRTESVIGTQTLVSPLSNNLAFTMVVAPSAPTNFRIVVNQDGDVILGMRDIPQRGLRV